jgi:hypothetical protein
VSITGLTRLNPKQILTSTIWNSLMDILEAKFSGSISESDIAWPLVAQGDIDFGQTYGIVGLRKFWNVVNAAEYASLDAAVSAAEATGGGAVMIPPYTTITANNVSIDASNIVIFGFGETSVIKITAASTNPLLTTASTGLSGISLENLMLDGTGGGAGSKGFVAKNIARLRLKGLYVNGFVGDAVYLTNDGTAGHACTNASIDKCIFNGGSARHIVADDVSGLDITNTLSLLATGDAINMTPPGSSNLIQNVTLDNTTVRSGGAKGISIVGSGAGAIDAQSSIHLRTCKVTSCIGLPIELGNTTKLLKNVTAVGCYAPSSTTDGMRIAASGGTIVDNHVSAAVGDGLDITNSINLFVSVNEALNAGAFGCNATSTTNCVVTNNDFTGAVSGGVDHTTSTGLRALENSGSFDPTMGNAYYDFASYPKSGTGDMGFTKTIKANTFKAGDVMRVTAFLNGGTATTTVRMKAGANSLGSFNTDANTNEVRYTVGIDTVVNTTHIILAQMRSAATVNVATASPAIDWTADVILTFEVTAIAGGTVTLNGVFIELLGSK